MKRRFEAHSSANLFWLQKVKDNFSVRAKLHTIFPCKKAMTFWYQFLQVASLLLVRPPFLFSMLILLKWAPLSGLGAILHWDCSQGQGTKIHQAFWQVLLDWRRKCLLFPRSTGRPRPKSHLVQGTVSSFQSSVTTCLSRCPRTWSRSPGARSGHPARAPPSLASRRRSKTMRAPTDAKSRTNTGWWSTNSVYMLPVGDGLD